MNRRDLLKRLAAGAAMLAAGTAPTATAARRAPSRCGTARCGTARCGTARSGNGAYGHEGVSDSDRIEWMLNNPPEDGIVWIPPGTYTLDRTITITPGAVSPRLKRVVIRDSRLDFHGVKTGLLIIGKTGAMVDMERSNVQMHRQPQDGYVIHVMR